MSDQKGNPLPPIRTDLLVRVGNTIHELKMLSARPTWDDDVLKQMKTKAEEIVAAIAVLATN